MGQEGVVSSMAKRTEIPVDLDILHETERVQYPSQVRVLDGLQGLEDRFDRHTHASVQGWGVRGPRRKVRAHVSYAGGGVGRLCRGRGGKNTACP
jgi:hypothetical protein